MKILEFIKGIFLAIGGAAFFIVMMIFSILTYVLPIVIAVLIVLWILEKI